MSLDSCQYDLRVALVFDQFLQGLEHFAKPGRMNTIFGLLDEGQARRVEGIEDGEVGQDQQDTIRNLGGRQFLPDIGQFEINSISRASRVWVPRVIKR